MADPLPDPAREGDIDFASVIESPRGQPRRHTAFCWLDGIAKVQIIQIQPRIHGSLFFSVVVLTVQRDQVVLGIVPRHGRHVGCRCGPQFRQIGPAVGIDDQIGRKIGTGRLDQNMDTFGSTLPLDVSPITHRTVSPAATGPLPTSFSPGWSMMSVISPGDA